MIHGGHLFTCVVFAFMFGALFGLWLNGTKHKYGQVDTVEKLIIRGRCPLPPPPMPWPPAPPRPKRPQPLETYDFDF